MAINLIKSTERVVEYNRDQLMRLMLNTGLGLNGLTTGGECQRLAQAQQTGRRVRVSVYDWIYDCYECRLKIFYTATPIAI